MFFWPIDGYQILGRTVHLEYVRKHLGEKKINLNDTQALPNNIQLTILADTVYVKVRIKVFIVAGKI